MDDMTPRRTLQQWRRILPTHYHHTIYPSGVVIFSCPMDRRDEIDAEAVRALGPGIRTSVQDGTNECPCAYWLSIEIPHQLVRSATPLESAIEKIRAIHFTPEERAALRAYGAA